MIPRCLTHSLTHSLNQPLDPSLFLLQALKDDPEVSIVRVKSSMTKSGLNPYVKTGFRFISVNLRIRNPQTTRLVMIPAALPVCFD